MTYVRYVSGKPPDNPWWLTGLVTLAQELLKAGALSTTDAKQVRAVFRWFNRNIPCPPYSAKRRASEWSEDAVSWFKPTATEAIEKIELLIPILGRHRLSTIRLQTGRIGRIVYSDPFQVVAETPPVRVIKRK